MPDKSANIPHETLALRRAAESAQTDGREPIARDGNTRVVSARCRAAAHRQLRVLAAQEDSTAQALLAEALNDLFRKRNLPPVA